MREKAAKVCGEGQTSQDFGSDAFARAIADVHAVTPRLAAMGAAKMDNGFFDVARESDDLIEASGKIAVLGTQIEDEMATTRPALSRLQAGDPEQPFAVACRRLAHISPFAGKAAVGRVLVSRRPLRGQAVVSIPACDEEALIPAVIAALAKAAMAVDLDCSLIIVVNNSADRTYEAASTALENWADRIHGAVVELTLDPSIANVGHARRFGLELAASIVQAQFLLSTDADTEVSENWIAEACSALRVVDMVCGLTDVDPVELALLPPSVMAAGDAESAMENAVNRLWRAVMKCNRRGLPNKGAGANMAMTASSYRNCGGLPPLSSNEDRALHELYERQGRLIAHSQAMCTRTSLRLESRTLNGMGACLVERAHAENPLLDDELMPITVLLPRMLLQRHLMQHRSSRASETERLAEVLQVAPVALNSGLGARPVPFWRDVADAIPTLAPVRISTFQAGKETRLAHQWAEQVENGQDPFDLALEIAREMRAACHV